MSQNDASSDDASDIRRPGVYHDEQRPDALEHWARSMPQPEPAKRERGLDTSPIDYARMMDRKIANERAFMIQVVAEALVEKLAEERAALKADRSDEIRQLKIEVANLETTIGELRQLLASDRAKTELPLRTMQ